MANERYSQDNPPPQLVEEIRKRLEGVCAEWPRPLFESVTARAAWIEFKYDRAVADTFKSMAVRAAAPTRFASAYEREGTPPGSP
jgi:hypothetical protein